MKRNKRKPVTAQVTHQSIDKDRGSEFPARLPWNYSPPTLPVEGSEKYYSTISFDVQLTVRSRVELNRKTLAMLAGLALSEVCEKGIGLSDWVVLEFLYSSLLGNKQTPYERKDPREFELSLLLKIVLLSGTWMGLEEKRQLPEDVQKLLYQSRFVPFGRTKASWKSHWQLTKYLEIRAVPLDVLQERRKDTIRYSSYTKGYGESSRMGRRQKTRPSAELDGEEVDLEQDKMMNLDLSKIGLLLSAVLLETKYTKRS